jgi:hypothetical protein
MTVDTESGMAGPYLVGRIALPVGLALCLSADFAWAQVTESGQIVGTVRDARRSEPLPGIHVELANVGREVFTDSQGYFRFAGLTAGAYVLRVSAAGCGAVTRGFDLDPGEIADVEVFLKGTPDRQVHTVEVRAGLFELPGHRDSPSGLSVSAAEARLAGVLADDPLRTAQEFTRRDFEQRPG